MRTFFPIFIILIAYSFLVALLYFTQTSHIFFPTREYSPPPSQLNIEEVYFETTDKVKLHGWWMKTENAKKTVLFFHGNAGNLSHREWQMEIFRELELNALIFDYRGYGKSLGKIKTEQDLYQDGEGAWTFLTKEKNITPESIIIWGRSVGGGIAVDLAQEKGINALILESTFYSMREVAQKHYWYMPIGLLLKYQFASGKKIKNVHAQILIIHSPEDEVIPFEQGKKLFDFTNEPKEFLQISGGHNDGISQSYDQYIVKLRDFLLRS